MERLFLSFSDIERYVRILTRQLDQSSTWTPDIIVGVARGGLIPAVMLSHKLETPMSVFDMSLRDGKTLSLPIEPLIKRLKGKRVLVVDDINDTGETFKLIRNYMSDIDYKFYCLVNNFGSGEGVDMYGMDIDKREKNVWVVFPWEADAY